MKNFDEWLRVRDNVMESWWSDPKRMWNNVDNSSIHSSNVKPGDDWDKRVNSFAEAIGLGNSVQFGSNIWNSLSKIVAARTYGEKYGAIQRPDIELIWNLINKPNDQGETIAKQHGISTPLAMVELVPQADAKMKWKYSPEVLELQNQVKNQNSKMNQRKEWEQDQDDLKRYAPQQPQQQQDDDEKMPFRTGSSQPDAPIPQQNKRRPGSRVAKRALNRLVNDFSNTNPAAAKIIRQLLDEI